jgi:hypothetical protein
MYDGGEGCCAPDHNDEHHNDEHHNDEHHNDDANHNHNSGHGDHHRHVGSLDDRAIPPYGNRDFL